MVYPKVLLTTPICSTLVTARVAVDLEHRQTILRLMVILVSDTKGLVEIKMAKLFSISHHKCDNKFNFSRKHHSISWISNNYRKLTNKIYKIRLRVVNHPYKWYSSSNQEWCRVNHKCSSNNHNKTFKAIQEIVKIKWFLTTLHIWASNSTNLLHSKCKTTNSSNNLNFCRLGIINNSRLAWHTHSNNRLLQLLTKRRGKSMAYALLVIIIKWYCKEKIAIKCKLLIYCITWALEPLFFPFQSVLDIWNKHRLSRFRLILKLRERLLSPFLPSVWFLMAQ